MATDGSNIHESSLVNSNRTMNGTAPKITLYTNHGCPFAQRAHITLDELNTPYEEVIIDLEAPRPQWYLDINPRGLVPAIAYTAPGSSQQEVITESAIVSQFLCDHYPTHLSPASNASPSAALTRARMSFFRETWESKIQPSQFAVTRAKSTVEKEEKLVECMTLIGETIEPLLANADPFFGGSGKLTFAEVMTAPFVQRFVALAEDGELVPKAFLNEMEKLPNFARWVKAVLAHGNATRIFEKERFLEFTRKRMENVRETKQ